MTTSCSRELLESALSGDLPQDREKLLHSHLDECAACSAALEQMAGGETWCREAARLLAIDDLDTVAPAHPSVGGDEWSTADFTVEHLDPAEEPGVLGRLGGYDVLEIIGRGGMGVVLKGFDANLKRCVAIKVLAPHLAQSSLARKRFGREAQAAAAVVHPNVLAIHQVQPAGRLPFLVMPLVAGESLAQRLAAQGRLELKEVLRIGMQAAAGLAAAHEQGLVHRDVKPANILLDKGVERAVLTDFGLARAADDVSMTRWGIISGTPQYMSPEQARGEPLDGRSDLFSLGCVLYEMATGVSPFRADSTLATLRRLIDDEPPAMAARNPELPPWFVNIVQRLLEKDPARRFASAKEVSELLEGCLAHLQQPASVPLPAVAHSPLLPGEGQGVRAAGSRRYRNNLLKGTLAMTALVGIALFAVAVSQTEPPDIAGKWQGDDWGQVVLTPTATGQYTGTYTDAVGKAPGKIDLKWSRIERRFNGTWSEGDDRFGDLSVRFVDHEIRGALTTDPKSKVNPATPRLADLTWVKSTASSREVFPSEKSKISLPAYRIEPPDILEIEVLEPVTAAASIKGQFLVGPDGTVNLRQYGVVHLAGKTVSEARAALQEHLVKIFKSPEISVNIAAYNSKVYYVITRQPGPGDSVHRFPVTGSETVLDAISQIGGLSQLSRKKMWIARPAKANVGQQKILTIDWDGVAQGAKTETNYQLLPGDRLWIVEGGETIPGTTEERQSVSAANPFADGVIPKGMRVVVLPVDKVNIDVGLIVPTARVDVQVLAPVPGTARQGDAVPMKTKAVFHEIRVFAVGDRTDAAAGAGSNLPSSAYHPPTVSLLVTPQQAEIISSAAAEGTFKLIARKDPDPAILPPPPALPGVSPYARSDANVAPQSFPPPPAVQAEHILALKKLYEAAEAQHQVGHIAVDELIKASDALLQAQLDAAKTRAEWIALRQKLIENRRKIEQYMQARFDTGACTEAELLRAKADRAEAESRLADEEAAGEKPGTAPKP